MTHAEVLNTHKNINEANLKNLTFFQKKFSTINAYLVKLWSI